MGGDDGLRGTSDSDWGLSVDTKDILFIGGPNDGKSIPMSTVPDVFHVQEVVCSDYAPLRIVRTHTYKPRRTIDQKGDITYIMVRTQWLEGPG